MPEPSLTPTLRTAEAADRLAIAAVHRLAFDSDVEPRLVDALVDGGWVPPGLSVVAVADDAVVGHVLFSTLAVAEAAAAVSLLALAPVAVLPRLQRRGIGSGLIREGLRRATEAGFDAVLVLGDPAYYQRFGFDVKVAAGLHTPYDGPHQMALALRPGALDAVQGATVTYPPPFAEA